MCLKSPRSASGETAPGGRAAGRRVGADVGGGAEPARLRVPLRHLLYDILIEPLYRMLAHGDEWVARTDGNVFHPSEDECARPGTVAGRGQVGVVGAHEFAFRRMHYELFTWAKATRDAPGAHGHPLTAQALAVAGYGRFVRGDLDHALLLADQSLEFERELGLAACGLHWRTVANVFYYRGQADLAADSPSRWSQRRAPAATTPAWHTRCTWHRSASPVPVVPKRADSSLTRP